MFKQRDLFSCFIFMYFVLHGAVYAENSYDIKGLNLESSISDVEKKLGCKVSPSFRDEKSTSTPDSYGTYCRKDDALYMISFDENKKILSIYASSAFDTISGWDDWDIAKDLLIKKYGKPNRTLTKKITEKNEKINRVQLCWGICKETKEFYLEPEMNSLTIGLDDTLDIETRKREISVSSFMSHTVRLEKHRALRNKWLDQKKKRNDLR